MNEADDARPLQEQLESLIQSEQGRQDIPGGEVREFDSSNMTLEGPKRHWLCRDLGREIMKGPRVLERMQLAAALLSAECLLVSERACKAADALTATRASTIPWKKLGMPPVTWIEYEAAHRPVLGSLIKPRTAGILLLRDPIDADAIIITGGWRGHLKDHAKDMGLWGAMARWSLQDLISHEPWSDVQAIEKLVGMGSFWLMGKPSSEQAGADSLWRLSIEATFAFSILALLTTSAAKLDPLDTPSESGDDERENLRMDVEPSRGLLAAIARRANPRGGIWIPPLGLNIWTDPAQSHGEGAMASMPDSAPISATVSVSASASTDTGA